MLENLNSNKQILQNEEKKPITSMNNTHYKQDFTPLENNIKPQLSMNIECKTTIEKQSKYKDSLYVTYVQNGFLNPGNIYPTYLNGGEIAFQVAFLVDVVPLSVESFNPFVTRPFKENEVELVSVFPKSINQRVSKQNMMVHTIDNSFSLGFSLGGSASGPNGGLSVGYSHSESFQTWKSKTYSIQDWGVKELSRPVSNKAIWLWHQQNPYDGSQYINDTRRLVKLLDKNNWFYSFPDLSKGTMEYSNSVSWRFNIKSLKNNELKVGFNSNIKIYYVVFNPRNKFILQESREFKHSYSFDFISSLYRSKLNSINIDKLLKYGKIA